jgi:hypothetical protein
VRFRDIPAPFVCCVLIEDPTPEALLRTIKLAEYDGADAFDLELQTIAPEFRNREALRPIFDATTLPIFTVYRRYALRGSTMDYQQYDESQRMQTQVDLIDIGSMGFDMELDTFDPQPHPASGTPEWKHYANDRSSPPLEISRDPQATERQQALIQEAHRRGGEVMASSHALTRLSAEAALGIGQVAVERGADAVKIVGFCADDGDVVDALAATVLLKQQLAVPFVMMGHGEYGKLVRTMSPMLGSMLVFARQTYYPGSFLDQPPVRAMRALFSNVDFRISRRAQSFLAAGSPAPSVNGHAVSPRPTSDRAGVLGTGLVSRGGAD